MTVKGEIVRLETLDHGAIGRDTIVTVACFDDRERVAYEPGDFAGKVGWAVELSTRVVDGCLSCPIWNVIETWARPTAWDRILDDSEVGP